MVVFYEGATLNTYTYDSGGFKKVENVSGNLSTIIWDGTDYLQVRGQTSAKTFHTVESQMLSYIESTLRYDFLTDNLGSIIAIMDENVRHSLFSLWTQHLVYWLKLRLWLGRKLRLP